MTKGQPHKSIIIVVLIRLILCEFGLQAQPVWEWQNPLPQGNTLSAVNFIDANTILAFGNQGVIVRSTDAGSTWENYALSSPSSITAVSFVNPHEGWAAGRDGMSNAQQILKTTDGGYNWFQVFKPTKTVRSLSFISSTTGWGAFENGEIHKTADGGLTWSLQFKDSTLRLFNVFFLDESYGWSVGGGFLAPTVLRTTDGGINWQTKTISPQLPTDNGRLWAVCFVNADTGWAVGEPRSVFKTSDGGVTWSPQSNPGIGVKTGVMFTSPTTGNVIGTGNMIMRTTNGGSTWELIGEPVGTVFQTADLNSVRFLSSSIGVIVGSGGAVFVSADNGSQWRRKVFGNRISLMSPFFLNSNLGWVTGLDNDTNKVKAVVLKTTNGGSTWRVIPIGLNNWPLGITFVDQNLGYVVGYAKYMLKTTDGGETWQSRTANFKGFLRSIQFVTGTTGWVVGDSGSILKTTDGGENWSNQSIADSVNLFFSSFVNTSLGWVGASRGKVYRTTDGGSSWTPQFTGGSYDIQALAFVDSNTGWVAGLTGRIFKTTNGGETWIPQTSGTTASLKNIRFFSDQTGYAFGFSGRVLKTSDGGNNWKLLKRFTNENINASYFLDSNLGWIVGDHGLIAKTSVGGGSETEIETKAERVNFGSHSYTLSQNYPNPFNPKTIIEFNVARTGRVVLSIYGLLGREVEKLVDQELTPGVFRTTWDASGFAAGVYFYRIQAEDFIETKKLILLK